MAGAREHIEKARHNESLLLLLEKTDTHPDWYITVAFYAAVHWLRAVLAQQNLGVSEADDISYNDFSRHYRRVYGNEPGTEEMLRQFLFFQRLSYRARYHIHSKHWYDQRLSSADTSLKAVRQYAQIKGLIL